MLQEKLSLLQVLAAAAIALQTWRHVMMGIATKPLLYIFVRGFRVYRLSLFSLMNQLADIAQQTMPSMNTNPFLIELA